MPGGGAPTPPRVARRPRLVAERPRHAPRDRWRRSAFDHLMDNAGHGDRTPAGQATGARVDRLVAVHVKGVSFLAQALPPLIADAS